MKGTVVSAWIKSCEKLYSKPLVDGALEQNGLPHTKVFTPLEDVDEALCTNLMDTIAQNAGVTKEDMWRMIGHENIETFFHMYSGFFRHESAYNFLKSMNDVHAIVMRRFKGAKPPVLDMEPISKYSAYFTYRSKRGMFDYFLGMLEGSGMHYGEEIAVQVIQRSESEMKLKLTFQHPVQEKRRFWLNLLFSFGILRSASVKTALLGGLLVSGAAYLFPAYAASPLSLGVLSLVSILVAALVLHLPYHTIKGEIKRLTNKDYSSNLHLRTADGYQTLGNELEAMKQGVQKDFIGFNAVVDEMYTFNKTVSRICLEMNKTSDNISVVIRELAAGANAQATDTEKSIRILDQNLTNVNQIAEEEQANSQLLEGAVVNIEQSFEGVQVTASQILGVLKQFNEIRNHGMALTEQVKSLTGIVSMVSQISQQTNLLALNASVEAARAGAAGKGFAVVASEVSTLAQRTKNAVESINGVLTNFVGKLEQLVSGVNTQYTVLEVESEKLSDAVNNSSLSNQQIKLVSGKLADTAQRLQEQTTDISMLFDKMHSLAAIAEENSAATDEANVSVHTYTEQTKELTRQILVFDKLIESFKEDLGRYSL
ncbi:heme NO-binding domain-containing protein [Oscillospiraceae bacterium MB08-C2-2]|nr:heme NO-binding domain-containing protein [Oscillospiraceae bacterium MB08-C2-2]